MSLFWQRGWTATRSDFENFDAGNVSKFSDLPILEVLRRNAEGIQKNVTEDNGPEGIPANRKERKEQSHQKTSKHLRETLRSPMRE